MHEHRSLSMHQPACYQITIQGRLATDWEDWFEHMTITHQWNSAGVTTTMLAGIVTDQAALHGILRKIAALGLLLLSVNLIDLPPS